LVVYSDSATGVVLTGAEQHCGLPVKVYLQYWLSVHESHDLFLAQTSASEAQVGMGFSVIGVTAAIWISVVVGILPMLLLCILCDCFAQF